MVTLAIPQILSVSYVSLLPFAGLTSLLMAQGKKREGMKTRTAIHMFTALGTGAMGLAVISVQLFSNQRLEIHFNFGLMKGLNFFIFSLARQASPLSTFTTHSSPLDAAPLLLLTMARK